MHSCKTYSRLISFYIHFYILFHLAQCCKRPGNFPLEEEGPCHHYISCTRDSLGFISREIKECPQGQFFQTSSNSCIYGDCQSHMVENPPEPEPEEQSIVPIDFNFNPVTQALSTFFPSLAKQSNRRGNPFQRNNNRQNSNQNEAENYDPRTKYINPDNSCPPTVGAYKIPGDCQRFYWCGAFITTLFKCPRNHQFKYGKCRQTESFCSSRYFGLPIPFYLRNRLVAGDDEDEFLPSISVQQPLPVPLPLPSEETTLISFPHQDYKTPPRIDAINPNPSNSVPVVVQVEETEEEPMALPSKFLPLAATTTSTTEISHKSSSSIASTSYSNFPQYQYQNESHFYISIFQLLLVHLFAQILF